VPLPQAEPPPTNGTVTSVGLVMPSQVYSITGSPVTDAGVITVTYNNQNANTLFAGPAAGGAVPPSFRPLVSADMPLPNTASLGGVMARLPAPHRFLTGIDTTGLVSAAQPDYSDLTGLPPMVGAPGPPTPTSLGGVALTPPVPHSFLTGVDATGALLMAQPVAADVAWPAQAINLVYAGPGSGGAAAPAFRPLVNADLPNAAVDVPWTPVVTFATPGDLSVSYTAQTAIYSRIGPLVMFRVSLSFTATFTTAAGNLQITGLPVAAAPGSWGGYIPTAISTITWPNTGTVTYLLLGGSTFTIVSAKSASAPTNWTAGTPIPSGIGFSLQFNGWYST
jgi:hypothetical protein